MRTLIIIPAYNEELTRGNIEEGAETGEGRGIWDFAHVRKGAKISKNCNIGKDVYIDVGVEIGNNVKIQNVVSVYQGFDFGFIYGTSKIKYHER